MFANASGEERHKNVSTESRQSPFFPPREYVPLRSFQSSFSMMLRKTDYSQGYDPDDFNPTLLNVLFTLHHP